VLIQIQEIDHSSHLFASFYNVSIGLSNCSESVVFFVFHVFTPAKHVVPAVLLRVS